MSKKWMKDEEGVQSKSWESNGEKEEGEGNVPLRESREDGK